MTITHCFFRSIFLVLVSKTKGTLKCTLVTSLKKIKKTISKVEPVWHQQNNEMTFVKPFSNLIVHF